MLCVGIIISQTQKAGSLVVEVCMSNVPIKYVGNFFDHANLLMVYLHACMKLHCIL